MSRRLMKSSDRMVQVQLGSCSSKAKAQPEGQEILSRRHLPPLLAAPQTSHSLEVSRVRPAQFLYIRCAAHGACLRTSLSGSCWSDGARLASALGPNEQLACC